MIHPTAVIDEGAVIGKGTNVWHYSHICSGASIGSDCTLGQNVYVGPKAVIGNNVKIQNNVSIFEGVTIEDDVFFGPGCLFTNVKNPRAFKEGVIEQTIVRRGATIGANATIVCGVNIGDYAFVAAGAVVTKDVYPFNLVAGVPARQIGTVDMEGNCWHD